MLISASLALAFTIGYLVRDRLGVRSEFGLLEEGYALLETHYIEELPRGLQLQRGMVRGMLEALEDPFTLFVPPEEHRVQSESLAGSYGGIGAVIVGDQYGRVYIEPFAQGPASDAGIVSGAELLAVDGMPLDHDLELSEVAALLRGPVGTTVQLRVRSPASARASTIELERAEIPLPSVLEYQWPGYDGVGILSISVFSDETPAEVERAVEKLADQGMTSLIIDLRNNGGGLLESSVNVARLFMREGIIVTEEGRGAAQEDYEVISPGKFVDIPLAVIVDGTTASGAEVLAAALQSNGRAPLIGSRTFGKGSVQVVVELSDGSSMRITSSRWLTPQGFTIDHVGLTPDVQLDAETAASEKALIEAAELLLEGRTKE